MGGDVQIAAYFNGELRNTGDITTVGGDAAEGLAGRGGGIFPEAWGGDLRSSGVMHARGGNSKGEGGLGGNGGDIQFSAPAGGDGLDESELDVTAGDIWVSGGASSRGGDALASDGSGGDAGYIAFDLYNEVTEGAQAIHVLGIEGLYALGGDADPGVMGSEGGDAGAIEINAGTISYGSATADGGTGETPGNDGNITPEVMVP